MLKELMDQIHDHLEMPELRRDFGTQTYEQQVVELSRDGERGRSREGLGGQGGLGRGHPGRSLSGPPPPRSLGGSGPWRGVATQALRTLPSLSG